MAFLQIVLIIAALAFGVVTVVESHWRNWAGWGVIALALVFLLPHLV